MFAEKLIIEMHLQLSAQSSYLTNGFKRLIASDSSACENLFQKITNKKLHSSQKYSNFVTSLRIWE